LVAFASLTLDSLASMSPEDAARYLYAAGYTNQLFAIDAPLILASYLLTPSYETRFPQMRMTRLDDRIRAAIANSPGNVQQVVQLLVDRLLEAVRRGAKTSLKQAEHLTGLVQDSRANEIDSLTSGVSTMRPIGDLFVDRARNVFERPYTQAATPLYSNSNLWRQQRNAPRDTLGGLEASMAALSGAGVRLTGTSANVFGLPSRPVRYDQSERRVGSVQSQQRANALVVDSERLLDTQITPPATLRPADLRDAYYTYRDPASPTASTPRANLVAVGAVREEEEDYGGGVAQSQPEQLTHAFYGMGIADDVQGDLLADTLDSSEREANMDEVDESVSYDEDDYGRDREPAAEELIGPNPLQDRGVEVGRRGERYNADLYEYTPRGGQVRPDKNSYFTNTNEYTHSLTRVSRALNTQPNFERAATPAQLIDQMRAAIAKKLVRVDSRVLCRAGLDNLPTANLQGMALALGVHPQGPYTRERTFRDVLIRDVTHALCYYS
jgi:hypothetical protein